MNLYLGILNQTMTEGNSSRSLRVCLLTLYLHESLGARQIDAVLRAHGHQSALIFLKEFRWAEFRPVTACEESLLLSLLRELSPQLIGINITSSLTADLAYEVADKLRAALRVPIVFGGAHVSVRPEECLQHGDYACVGEGEEAILELVAALAAGRATDAIANLWTKVNGEVKPNEVRPLVQDLDRYPPVSFGEPDSYFIEEDRLQRLDPATLIPMYHTTAARMGCPFNCAFCGGVYLRRELYAGKGPVRRFRRVGAILSEIARAKTRNPHLRIVQFWDEVFAAGASPEWLEEFCARYPREVGLPFGIWAHPALVTEEQVRRLKDAGLATVVMGVESGSAQVRREVLNRKETNARILASAEILHRHGIKVGYDFILDIPWLTEENCQGTFDLVMQLPRPFEVGLHSLTFLPRTALGERALAEGLIRPEQIAQADRPLAERFESFRWKYRLDARSRRAAYWHSLIYLASMSFVPHSLLRRLRRLKPLLQRFPQPLVLAAEVARRKQATGETQLFEAFAFLYPGPAAFLARHPLLARALHAVLRPSTLLARRVLRV